MEQRQNQRVKMAGIGGFAGANGTNFYGYTREIVYGDELKIFLNGIQGEKGHDRSKAFHDSMITDQNWKF